MEKEGGENTLAGDWSNILPPVLVDVGIYISISWTQPLIIIE